MNRGLSEIKPYVGGKQGEEAIRKYKVQKPIKMSSNENPLGVSPSAVAGAEEILPGANMYPDGSNRELREKIAAKYALSLDSIIVGNGADEIIYYLAMGFINDDDEVIIPRLTFPIYEIACRMMRDSLQDDEGEDRIQRDEWVYNKHGGYLGENYSKDEAHRGL
jgi:histidinol-phosphate aminotransferase